MQAAEVNLVARCGALENAIQHAQLSVTALKSKRYILNASMRPALCSNIGTRRRARMAPKTLRNLEKRGRRPAAPGANPPRSRSTGDADRDGALDEPRVGARQLPGRFVEDRQGRDHG